MADHLFAQSHIYPGFAFQVSSLTHLNQGVRIFHFLDQAVADFEHGLDSILTVSVKTLELDASFDEPVVVISSVFWGSICSVPCHF